MSNAALRGGSSPGPAAVSSSVGGVSRAGWCCGGEPKLKVVGVIAGLLRVGGNCDCRLKGGWNNASDEGGVKDGAYQRAQRINNNHRSGESIQPARRWFSFKDKMVNVSNSLQLEGGREEGIWAGGER